MPRKSRRPPLTIERQHLQPGIDRCCEVAGWRLREAATLLDTGSAPVTAAILFSFAVEEFGKAILLREAYEKGQSPVTIDGFYDHRPKIEAAGRYVPGQQLLLHEGTFDRGVFDSRVFDIGNPADLDARVSGLYVNWRDGGWHVGVSVDREVLKANIGALAQIVMTKRAEWT